MTFFRGNISAEFSRKLFPEKMYEKSAPGHPDSNPRSEKQGAAVVRHHPDPVRLHGQRQGPALHHHKDGRQVSNLAPRGEL
jgi:hypothetical protein